jgi:diguanylate cyclase (GGDEF)-like protein
VLDLPAIGRPSTFGLRKSLIAPDLSLDYVTKRGRERLAFGLSCVLAAIVCAAALPAGHQLSAVAPAAALLFAVAMLFNLRIAPTGWVACTQAAFVLLAFAVPLNLVPLLVLALSAATQFRGRPLTSLLTAGSNCWYAIGTVGLLALLAPGPASWSHWPAYVVTFSAAFAFSSLVYAARCRVRGWDVSLSDELAVLGLDACLTTIGLVAAVDLRSAPVAAVALMTGVTGLLALVDHEHGERRAQTERALRDPLTDLANRALFHEAGAACEARCARSGQQAGLLLIDLDDFKDVNDSRGHLIGDEVLCVLAQALRDLTRPSDVAARLGGDEFALILCEPIEFDDAGRVADALRQRVAHPVTLSDGQSVNIGLSIGLALFGHETSLEEALVESDRALYADKRSRKD